MVLESLGQPVRLEKKPKELFFLTFSYSIIAILLSIWVFPQYAGLTMVFFSVMAAIPMMIKMIIPDGCGADRGDRVAVRRGQGAAAQAGQAAAGSVQSLHHLRLVGLPFFFGCVVFFFAFDDFKLFSSCVFAHCSAVCDGFGLCLDKAAASNYPAYFITLWN